MQKRLGVVGSTLLAAGVFVAGTASVQAQAAKPSAIYVFGDSLSDRGNLAELYYRQNFPNPPSYHDSFTNGNVALEVMAMRVGLTLDPSLWVTGFQDTSNLFGAGYVPGTNYAVAAATASAQAVGGLPVINLPQQIAAYETRSGGNLDPNALYTVLIGGNDVRNAAKQGTGASAVTAGVQAELTGIQTLIASGAKNLLVINVPNVGAIPEFTQAGLGTAGTQYTIQYNNELAAGIAAIAAPSGVSLKQFDLYSYSTSLSAQLANQGFNTTDPCYINTPLSAQTSAACGSSAENISKFYYWDSIHPTAAVDNIVGNALADFEFGTAAAVPELGTWAMMIVGMGAIGFAMRRRQKVTTRIAFAA